MSEKRKDWKAQINWDIAPQGVTHFGIGPHGHGRWLHGSRIAPFDWADGFLYYGDFSAFDFGDWKETLVERPK